MPDEYVFAYLDDIYVVCLPERVSAIYKLLSQALEENARESKCIWARRKFGTEAATCPQGVIPCRLQLNVWTRTQECGVVKDRFTNKGFVFWGSPSGMSILFRRSSDQNQRCTGFCTNASCRCKTCKVRGCFSCSAPMPGPRIRCVESRLLKLLSSQRLMMRPLVNVS